MVNFIKRITGAIETPEFENENETNIDFSYEEPIEDDVVTDLPFDIYEDNDNVFLRSFIPAVEPDKIDISLTRSSVSISGERVDTENIDFENFKQKELVWGKFDKHILLPHEVDVDKVKAKIQNGMLILKMPKLDKDRSVKIALNDKK